MHGPRWMWPVNVVKAAGLIAFGLVVALWPFCALGLLLVFLVHKL